MRFHTLSLCLAALALAGCANTNISGTHSAANGGPAPKTIVVSDLAFSSDVVALDRGFTARLSRKIGEIPPHQRKEKTVERVNDEIVATIVATLRQAGLDARLGSADGLSSTDDAVVVTGRLRAVDEGNSTKRRLIGFGEGRSNVGADMQLERVGHGGRRPLLSFTAEAQSRRRPGAVVTVPVGLATSAAIGAVLAGGGMVSEKLSADVEAQARGLGRAAAEKIIAYAKEQGWLEKPESAPEEKPES
jgi:hypothetical protein